jgi:peptide/nickel transport system substrate-binding protein
VTPAIAGRRRYSVHVVAALLALVAAASAGADPQARAQSGRAFVFGTNADPVVLDPALSFADPAAARVAKQMFESLVDLAPGTTRVVPKLATSWKTSKDGLTWSFALRRNVRFQDGTPLDAAAVCFNFERWYGFAGSLQRAAYMWTVVFGGFRKPAPGSPGPANSLYRDCHAVGAHLLRLRLRRRSAAFLAALADPAFGIASPTALRRYAADAGQADADGVFHPTGTYAIAHPTGTGPFMFKSWRRREQLVLVRNPGYWGTEATLGRVVFRPIVDRLARLRALERGRIDALDGPIVGEEATIRRNRALKIVERPPSNVGYVGINQSLPPMDNLLVRRAIAYGLDRARVARSYYTGHGQLADQFLPPVLVGHAADVARYTYDPEKSRALLRKAGLKLPVKVDFWYPTGISRPYMLDPRRNFETFAASLARAGFDVVPHSAPWAPDYVETVFGGKAQLFLLGWLADFQDPANFFDGQFDAYEPGFGFRNQKLFALVRLADAEPNLTKRARLYRRASRMVMQLLPIVPYVYFKFPVVLRRNVTGFVPESGGPWNESFAGVGFR